jgi:hypothetical protein
MAQKLVVPMDTHTVYMICNPLINSVYYGFTKLDINMRFRDHMNALVSGYHYSKELQAAFNRNPLGWTVHQIAKLPEWEADALETDLIEGDMFCFNVQKNPRKVKTVPCQITLDQLIQVQELLNAGDKYQYHIARITGVTPSIVSQISRGVHSLQGAV